MEPPFRSLLYDRPDLYDLVFPDPGETLVGMCRQAFARYLPSPPTSLVDLGCGNGHHLVLLGASIAECWGVDVLESNIAFARSRGSSCVFRDGDMRTVRLGRTFDAVICLGNALSYLLTDEELAQGVATFDAHARPGSLLVLDLLNARCYLDGDGFRERIEGRIETPDFTADSVAVHRLDRLTRRLKRTRTWRTPRQPDVVDVAEYRLLYPEEIRRLLGAGGFEVLAMYDNREFKDSDLAGTVTGEPDCAGMRGRKLYVFARKS
ncbi:MAG TPA: class I SAM-dependent methyltransferase [Methylomirabilota bacterium]|jgi:SAM-dependent methyltransferase|nr:class I SAM-dependent methyltransferase [Methylomirabilota bacterium]